MLFNRNEHVVAVFFDLEKAYDRTWRYHILKSLKQTGLAGHLPAFIKNFLTNRIMKIRNGNIISDPYTQWEGVPQGSVLSCSLFTLAINGLTSALPRYVENSLYVDDFAIFANSANLQEAERRIQIAVRNASKWTKNHGFNFSTTKTVCMHFTKKRGIFPQPTIMMAGNTIQYVEKTKFLGLILDRKLLYTPHIKELRLSCLRSLNILKSLSRHTWGADRTTLLHIYRALIRSKLDYACQIYCSASTSTLKMLDPVHNQALRLCTGALRSSPIQSLYAETGESSLQDRRDKLSLQLYIRMLGMPGTPAHEIVTNRIQDNFFNNNRTAHTTIGYRIRKLLSTHRELDINVYKSLKYDIPPFTKEVHPLCNEMSNYKKSTTPPNIMRNLFNNHFAENHAEDLPIYTDGSKVENGTGFGVITPRKSISRKLPTAASIFTAELHAILFAVAYAIRLQSRTIVIISDSRSALKETTNIFSNHPIVRDIHQWNKLVTAQGKTIKFCWVPAHVDVEGNEKADDAALRAATGNAQIPELPLPHKDYYNTSKKIIHERWSNTWTNTQNNKLRKIKSDIREWATSCRENRRQERILCRLRIGHTKVTHSHLMSNDPPPYCNHCIVPLTVEHILTECPDHLTERRRFYGANHENLHLERMLRDDENTIKTLFDFIETIGMMNDF